MSALQHVSIDHVVDLAAMPDLLTRLAREPVTAVEPEAAAIMRTETEIAAGENPLQAGSLQLGQPSHFTCPECHGVLGEVREGSIVRFRCHTGHAFSAQSLLANMDESIDANLWSALRGMQERAIFLREAAARARKSNAESEAVLLDQRANDCDAHASLIRELLEDLPTVPAEESQGSRQARE